MPSEARTSPTPSVEPAVATGAAGTPGGVESDAPMLGGLASAIALSLTMFVEAVGYGVVAPTLPFLARSGGAGDAQIGFLVGLYAAVGLVAGIPFGALANRFGRRALVLVGLGCLTAASVGFVLAPSYGWLVAARFTQGLGATAIWVGALTIAADLSPDASMGRSLSWITGAWSLGFVVGPALGGVGSVRFPFLVYAVLSAAAFAAGFVALPETGRLGVRTTFAGLLRVLKYPAVLASAAATFALSFYYGTIEAFGPLLADQMGVRRIGIGILFAVAGLPSIALPRFTGMLADRVGDTRLIIGGLVYAAALNAAFLPLVSALPLWAVFFLVGLVEVLIYVPAVALLNRGMARDDRVYATASHSYAFSSGFFLGPLIGGFLKPLGSYPLLFATLTAVLIGATACLVAWRRRIEAS
ncbi:MAG TPA: MFS transporter [Candidatus Dormibacteraeota bacterium]|nr:MFS transporter [Candidatus Dormibacteraeota bacterium]